MRRILYSLPLLLLIACQREAVIPNQDPAASLPRLVQKVAIDSNSTQFNDTVGRTLYTYDAQGRLSGMRLETYSLDTLSFLETITLFYQGMDTLAYKATQESHDYHLGFDTREARSVWYTYQNGLRVRDSIVWLHHQFGQTSTDTAIVTYTRAAGMQRSELRLHNYTLPPGTGWGFSARTVTHFTESNAGILQRLDSTWSYNVGTGDYEFSNVYQETDTYFGGINPLSVEKRHTPGALVSTVFALELLDGPISRQLPASYSYSSLGYSASSPGTVQTGNAQIRYVLRPDGLPSSMTADDNENGQLYRQRTLFTYQ